jgi:hypothetical protein
MELPEVRMSFPDRASLERELDQNLRHGRAFVPCVSNVPVLSECMLVLVHPAHDRELRLAAQVVMVNESGPMCGVGIALRSFSPEDFSRVEQFARLVLLVEPATLSIGPAAPEAELPLTAATTIVHEPELPPMTASTAEPEAEVAVARATSIPAEFDAAANLGLSGSSAADWLAFTQRPPGLGPPPIAAASTSQPTDALAEAEPDEPITERTTGLPADALAREPEPEPTFDETELAPEDSQRPQASELQVGSRQEKLRHLNAAQQLKVARRGELADRIAVERLYGKQVWEALLQNPRLSIPEVARIARKGTVPKPLLEQILEHPGWIKADAVRRALLSNPKLGADAVMKLLRATPKHELKIIERGTAYGGAVRDLARKLLKQ